MQRKRKSPGVNRKPDTKWKRKRITKTEAARSLLELHSSLEKKSTESEELAAQALLDLECSRINNIAQPDENLECIKYKEVNTQVYIYI